jgi:hypothetical protein
MHPAAQQLVFRALSTGQYLPAGAGSAEPFDTRVIFALDPSDDAPIGDLSRVTSDHVFAVPPLRERRPDLGLLLARMLKVDGTPQLSLAADAVRTLVSHPFPGNHAQLAAVLPEKRDGGIVCAADLVLPRSEPSPMKPRERRDHDAPKGSDSAGWILDNERRTVRSPNGVDTRLTHQEAVFLTGMFAAPGAVVTREGLLRDLGKTTTISNLRNLDTCVARLRRKLLAQTGLALPLHAAYGEGYVLFPS